VSGTVSKKGEEKMRSAEALEGELNEGKQRNVPVDKSP